MYQQQQLLMQQQQQHQLFVNQQLVLLGLQMPGPPGLSFPDLGATPPALGPLQQVGLGDAGFTPNGMNQQGGGHGPS